MSFLEALLPPKFANLRRIRGLGGMGIAADVTMFQRGKAYDLTVFKMGSDGDWCYLDDGSSCPHEVMGLWNAYKARNLLAGKPAYEIESAAA